MKDNEQLFEEMSQFFDGELEGIELENFEEKLRDPLILNEYKNYAIFLKSIDNVPKLDIPSTLHERIMRNVKEEARPIHLIGDKNENKRSSKSIFSRKSRAYASLAAVFVAGTIIIASIVNNFNSSALNMDPIEILPSILDPGISRTHFYIDDVEVDNISVKKTEVSFAVSDLHVVLSEIELSYYNIYKTEETINDAGQIRLTYTIPEYYINEFIEDLKLIGDITQTSDTHVSYTESTLLYDTIYEQERILEQLHQRLENYVQSAETLEQLSNEILQLSETNAMLRKLTSQTDSIETKSVLQVLNLNITSKP